MENSMEKMKSKRSPAKDLVTADGSGKKLSDAMDNKITIR